MPEVPYTGLPSTSPREAPPDDYQRVNVNPEQFGGAIGRGVQEAGKGAEQLGNDFFQTSEFQGKINADEQTTNWLTGPHEQVLYGDPSKTTIGPDGNPVRDTGYMGLRGADALRARAGALKAIEDARQQGEDNLKTPYEKLQYRTQTRRMFADTETKINTHANQQFLVHAETVNEAGAASAREAYARNVQTDPGIAQKYGEDYVHQKVQAAQVKFGFDPTIEKHVAESAKLDLLKIKLDQIATDQPKQALDLLKQPDNKDIAGSQYDDIYGRLRARATAQTGQLKADKYVADATKGGVGPVGMLPAQTAAFLRQRSGSARVDGVNPVFADRLVKAASDFETENPGRLARFESLNRTRDEQARLYQRYQTGQGGLAAPPGQSRHEYGLAADVPDGAFLNWLHENGSKYGLEFLKGKSFLNDSGHVQLAGAAPGAGQAVPRATGQATPQPAAGGGLMPVPTPVSMPGAPMPPVEAPGGVVTVAPPHVEMPVAETQTPTLRMQLASALRSAINDPDMNDDERKVAEAAIQQRFRVLEISENQQAETAKSLARDTADGYFQEIRRTRQSSTPDYVGLDKRITDDKHLDYETRKELTRILDEESGGKFDRSLGEGYWPVWQAINLPDSDPNKIVDEAQIYPLVRPGGRGSLTPAGAEKILSSMKQQQTVAGKAFAETEKNFLKEYAHPRIVGPADGDPAGVARWLNFNVAFQEAKKHAIEEAKEKHIAPFAALADLYDEKSKNYLGNLIKLYEPPTPTLVMEAINSPSLFSQATGMLESWRGEPANAALPLDPAKITSPAELKRAFDAGQISGPDANRIGRERGWMRPAAPQVPVTQ